MRNFIAFLIMFLLNFATLGVLHSQTLFIDTFEEDTIDKAPKKWKHVKGNAFDKNPGVVVVEDPTRPGNKVYSQTGLRVYGHKGKMLDDFTYEFAWMFDKNANVNIAWRIQDQATQCYYATRRRGGTQLRIYKLDGNSTLLNENKDKWESQPNVWYVMQIHVQGAKHTIKIKKPRWRGDYDFGRVDPFLEFSNDAYPKGRVGFWGASGAHLYVDNVIVYGPKGKTEDIPFTVQSKGKLTAVWGYVKNQ